MSLTRTIHTWVLQTGPDRTVGRLVLAPDEDLVGGTPQAIAQRLQVRLQEAVWKGEPPGDVLGGVPDVRVEPGAPLSVTLAARRDGHPAVDLVFPTLLVYAPTGVLALAPNLGAAWTGPTKEEAHAGLCDWVRLDLSTRAEPPEGPDLLALCQANPPEVTQVAFELVLPTFSEVREHARAQGGVLAKVAPPITVAPAWGIDDRILALLNPLLAGRSALLVGPHGAGKTACIRALVHELWGAHFGDRTLREVTPPTFLLDLLALGTSWQDGLARVCAEVKERGDTLYVTRLVELFEVGRHEGNTTSVGEYLQPWLARGDVRILSECTSEELAILEALYPGALDGIVRVPFPEPADLAGILTAWAHHRAAAIYSDEALRECLRLHRRFLPYSGLPGRAIRFLDAMADEVDRDAVFAAFCAQSGLPLALVDPRASLTPAAVEEAIASRVFGQPEAVAAVVDVLLAVKADVARSGKPLASMLLVGPTGVGKTEMARAVATFLFGSASRMVRFDMSEYASADTVMRLVEGWGGEGQLTGAVRRQPFSVILLDEIEKAHSVVLDLLLQVLGEGRLTERGGRVADFSATIVIMTSNVGAVAARRPLSGFSRTEGLGARYLEAVRGWLRPELLNRIDRVLAFAPLDAASVDRVLDRELAALRRRPGLVKVPLHVDDATRRRIAAAGFDPRWGGRQLLRSIHEQLAVPLARALGATKLRSPVAEVVDGQVHLAEGPLVPVLHGVDEAADLALSQADKVRRLASGNTVAALRTELRRLKPEPNRYGEGDRLRALLTMIDDLRASAEEVVLHAGTAALLERDDPGIVARVEAQAAALRRVLLATWTRRYPMDHVIIGIYGPPCEGIRAQLVALYERVAVGLGLKVNGGPVYPPLVTHADGLEEVYWALPGRARPINTGIGEGVGWEMSVVGPGARHVFECEMGGFLLSPPVVPRRQRLRVVVECATEAEWDARRPKDFERQHFLDTEWLVGQYSEHGFYHTYAGGFFPTLAAAESQLGREYYDWLLEDLE